MAVPRPLSWDEIKRHTSETDAWIVVNNWVVDCTSFWKIHPGGAQPLKPWLGRDATEVFRDKRSHVHSASAIHLLRQFRIGYVAGTKSDQDLSEDARTAPKSAAQYGVDLKKGLLWQAAALGPRYDAFLHDVLLVGDNQGTQSLRYFDNEVLELFTRSPWWLVPLVWFPIVALLVWASGLSRSLALTYLVLGPVWWTFLEYTLHRWAFHMRTGTVVRNYMHMMMHGYHHLVPMDPLRLTFPPVPAAIIGLIIYLPVSLLLGRAHALAFMSGLVLGYIGYDCIHFWLHHAAPGMAFGGLKRAHLYHHYKNPQRNFGISSPVADWIFGTYEWA